MWLVIAVASLCSHSPSDIELYQDNDTIVMLESVEIRSEKHELFTGSVKRQGIDHSIIKDNQHSDVATLLSTHTPVSVKSYGPGILATTSLRGGSASHTAFVWNGFNLQSPMHAQNDLSLIPVSFADEMEVQYSGGSALWGTGTVGGAVIMNNKPDFSPGIQAGYHSSATSNSDFHNSINTSWSNGVFATSLRLFHDHSKNQYYYINSRLPDNPKEKQEHADFKGWGLLQETHYKPNNQNVFSIRAWHQQYRRKIPPTLFQNKAQARQDDDFLRLTAQWQGLFNNIRLDVKTGYFEDYIYYYDNTSIDSESRSQKQISEAELRYYLTEKNTFSMGFNHQYIKADVDDYSTEPSENKYTITASWRRKNEPENFIASLNFRQKFTKEYDVEPTPGLGITYKPLDKLAINANVARSYRLPTLNDRYWSPGGNPDLKPESGWTQDINFELSNIIISNTTDNLKSSISLDNASIAVFHRKMTNWISWTPGSGGLWTPQNILEVRSYGAEVSNTLAYKYTGKLNIRTTIFYSWTKSLYEETGRENDASIGKQLVYTPEHQAGININISAGSYRLSYNHRLTGRRYTTSDNSRWLEPYDLADISAEYTRKIMSVKTSVFIKIHNLWNRDYEVMQARPMPLRYFRAGLNINIGHN